MECPYWYKCAINPVERPIASLRSLTLGYPPYTSQSYVCYIYVGFGHHQLRVYNERAIDANRHSHRYYSDSFPKRSPELADEMTTPLWCDEISAGLLTIWQTLLPLSPSIFNSERRSRSCRLRQMSGSNFSCRETILFRRYWSKINSFIKIKMYFKKRKRQQNNKQIATKIQ